MRNSNHACGVGVLRGVAQEVCFDRGRNDNACGLEVGVHERHKAMRFGLDEDSDKRWSA